MAWDIDRSKLNATELAKLDKDGLDVIRDFARFAEAGFDSIPKEDFDRMKWYGLYVQRPKADKLFMLRLKLPGGRLKAGQARVLAELGEKYGRGIVDISTRQSIQFHYIRIEDLPEILAKIEAVDLTTTQAAGDCPRNIVGSPIAGMDQNEFFDSRPIIETLNRFFEGNREFSNLPRKFKISVSTNPAFNPNHEINDLAFYPAVKVIDGQAIDGFHIKVGGGLSAQPRQADVVNVFVSPDKVVKVAAATAAIFRDHGYREKRNHARLKFLIQDWGIEKFTQALLAITGSLPSRGEDRKPEAYSFYGIHPQKQAGLNYLGLSVPIGRMSAQELGDLAELAEQFGDGTINTTHTQDILLLNIPDQNIESLLKAPALSRISADPKPLVAQALVCTGKEFCPFAATDTKNRFSQIIEKLQQDSSFDEAVEVHVTGCLHSCAQPQIAEIGLQGIVGQTAQKEAVEAFEFYIGGRITKFGQKLTGRVRAEQTIEVIAAWLRYYKEQKRDHESFNELVERQGIEPFQKLLKPFAL